MRNQPDFPWGTVKLLVVLGLAVWCVWSWEPSVPELLVWD